MVMGYTTFKFMMISLPMYRALCYADVFGFPLTMEEMQRFAVLTWGDQTGETPSRSKIYKNVVNRQGYHCLLDRQSLISQRISRLPLVKEKIRLASAAANLFGVMPTVSAVFVTGGLAVGNVKKEDDIDFFSVSNLEQGIG